VTPDSIDAFVERLASGRAGPNSVNPFDFSQHANAVRRQNLTRYLEQLGERSPSVLLVGEAPGYRGMRITGVPFTNTVILERGIPHFGLFGTENGYSVPSDLPPVAAEPTATVMWDTLVQLDFLPLLWSAYPLHPHRMGNPRSNRTPSRAEAAEWAWSWRALEQLFSIRTTIAVGRVAYESMVRSGLSVSRVRHPAHGGKELFAQGLRDLLAEVVD
jgi:uracil-DNA glycosylase